MATIKIHTDLSQSKTLSKILPLESADMWFANSIIVTRDSVNEPDDIKSVFPCWSLSALLGVLPEGIKYYAPNLQKEDGKYSIAYGDDELLCIADNPVDACYELILKLHELKKL